MTRATLLFLAGIALIALGGLIGYHTQHAAIGVIIAYLGLVLTVAAPLNRRRNA